uniref:Uncharacterized protein n=1 Tax=Arundo donax TaxID=35708 RepID=A0A0A9FMR2_ARUDO
MMIVLVDLLQSPPKGHK